MDGMSGAIWNDIERFDPINEVVIFRFYGQWNSVGPLTSHSAKRFLKLFKKMSIPAFISFDIESLKKEIPVHPIAKDYFSD